MHHIDPLTCTGLATALHGYHLMVLAGFLGTTSALLELKLYITVFSRFTAEAYCGTQLTCWVNTSACYGGGKTYDRNSNKSQSS